MFGKSSFLDLEPSTTVIHADSVSFLTYFYYNDRIHNGEDKNWNEFVEWHVAWLAD